VITRANTRIPIDINTVVVHFDRLIRGIDAQKLTVLVDGLGDAFAGTGEALQRLLDAGQALTRTLQAELPETLALVRDGRTVLETARLTQGDLRAFAKGLADLSESLRTADPDVRLLLDNGVKAARELDALLGPSAGGVSDLLRNLVTVNNLQVARLGGLRLTLENLPQVVKEGPESIVDGLLHNGLVTEPLPFACVYDTERRLPRDYSPREPNLAADCAPGTHGQRGSAYAPHPGDTGATGGGSGPGTAAAKADGGVVSSLATPYAYWAAQHRALVGDESWLELLLAML
jgi:phospholipid/cholesterol/gamma-HCH transport system substrate-binding protein